MNPKKYYLLLLTAFLFTLISWGQTKIIAHKSHSGKQSTFTKLLAINHYDLKTSNFGVAPEPTVRTARLDSVIYVSKNKAIMVTTEICTNRYGDDAIKKEWNYAINDWSKALEVSKDKKSSVWKAGRDTVYNHPLFSRNESLDSIKNVIRKHYYFKNDVNDIIFVGYSNKPNPQPKENNYILVSPIPAENGIVNVKLNGMFLSTGDCSATIAYGIQEQKTGSQVWQNIVDINYEQMTCGLPYVEFQNSPMQLDIHQFWQSTNPINQQKFMPSGKYRLFVHLYATQVIIYSNEFYIK
jgi:hypothetical protein